MSGEDRPPEAETLPRRVPVSDLLVVGSGPAGTPGSELAERGVLQARMFGADQWTPIRYPYTSTPYDRR
ncbi:hypothetical protein [Streptomyces sp. OE57]|uniref:hypothetical protein n=1 Tax=Streptomyces lacaronensis TaxID=3379885 RepID=UPI0039B78840